MSTTSTTPGNTRPHALYRFYDAAGALLYVGITLDPVARWRQHRDDKPWWTDVAHITVDTYPDRATVLDAERAAITRERPLHNVQHNRGPATHTLTEQNDIMLALIGADPADGPFGSQASHMPDDCHEHCVRAGICSIYYPFVWRRGRGHYLCQNGHYWTCGWGHNLSGTAPEHAGHAIDTVLLATRRPR